MNLPVQQRINRITWRARRGVRELDGLLMPYAQQLRNLGDADDLALFEELLTQPDPLLMDWFMRRDIPDNPHLTVLISDILRFSRTSGSA